ncbi:hypothetical protein GGF32_006110 [Allomyces javanicus]|nr:hypothetical protein GGF32_006110 [Allomyces javanicus]
MIPTKRNSAARTHSGEPSPAVTTASLPRDQRLPRILYDTYKQYKADTSRLAEWLVTIVESLDRPTLAPAPSSATLAEGKGKAKAKRLVPVTRNAKHNANRKNSEQNTLSVPSVPSEDGADASIPRIIVKFDDFVIFALRIADVEKAVLVSVLK